MSQLFDYFVCTPAVADEWITALEKADEYRQLNVEQKMLSFRTLRNVGQDDFIVLAALTNSESIEVWKVIGQVDLVKQLGEDGPWVMAFRNGTITDIAECQVDQGLLDLWVTHMAEYHGRSESQVREILNADAAASLKSLCTVAKDENLKLYCCLYG